MFTIAEFDKGNGCFADADHLHSALKELVFALLEQKTRDPIPASDSISPGQSGKRRRMITEPFRL